MDNISKPLDYCKFVIFATLHKQEGYHKMSSPSPSPSPLPSRLCSHVILSSCKHDESGRLYDIVQQCVIENNGDESNIEAQLVDLLDQCSDEKILNKVLEKIKKRLNKSKNKQPGAEQAEQSAINMLRKSIKTVDSRIQSKLVDQGFTKFSFVAENKEIRQALVKYYTDRGYVTSSYPSGEVEISLKFTDDIVQNAMEKIKRETQIIE